MCVGVPYVWHKALAINARARATLARVCVQIIAVTCCNIQKKIYNFVVVNNKYYKFTILNYKSMCYDVVLHLRLPLCKNFNGIVEREHLAELEDYVFDAADKWLVEHPQYPCSCLVSDKTEVESGLNRIKSRFDGK